MKYKAEDSQAGLSRRLRLLASTLAGIGVILGADIYVLVGVAAKQSGNAVSVLAVFSNCGCCYRFHRAVPRTVGSAQAEERT